MKNSDKPDPETEYRDLLKKLRIHPVSQEFVSNTFSNRTNLKIFFRGWNSINRKSKDKLIEPDKSLVSSDKPLNIIVFCHGMISHSRPYILLADEFFSREGTEDFLFFALDYQGHGFSEGYRGYFKGGLDVLIDDVEDFILHLSSKYPNAKFSLWGESMGGLIALTYCVERYTQSSPYEIKSSVLWSPAIRPYTSVSLVDIFQGIWGLLVYVFSRKTNTMPARSGTCFKNPDFDHLDAIDPQKLFVISMGYLLAINSVMNRVQKRKFSNKLTVPTCFLIGTADVVVTPKATLKFYNKITDNDSVKKDQHRLISIEKAWHNLYYDEDMTEEHWASIM